MNSVYLVFEAFIFAIRFLTSSLVAVSLDTSLVLKSEMSFGSSSSFASLPDDAGSFFSRESVVEVLENNFNRKLFQNFLQSNNVEHNTVLFWELSDMFRKETDIARRVRLAEILVSQHVHPKGKLVVLLQDRTREDIVEAYVSNKGAITDRAFFDDARREILDRLCESEIFKSFLERNARKRRTHSDNAKPKKEEEDIAAINENARPPEKRKTFARFLKF